MLDNFYNRLILMGLNRGVAQVGSALGSGLRSRWFKSSRPDFISIA
jgi:hypothetical protein